MTEQTYEYQNLLFSEIETQILLPRLSLRKFFSAVEFFPEKYIFDLEFWLELNKLDDNTMFTFSFF